MPLGVFPIDTPYYHDTPNGRICLGTPGDDYYQGDFVVLIDPGGNATYHNCRIVAAYGRGYYPHFLAMLRELAKIETRTKRRVLPHTVWELYDRGWRRFERTSVGCHTLQCVGILAQTGSA